jgi:transposase
MTSSSYFVGVDVSKPFLDVHRLPDQAAGLPDQAARRFANTAAGHRQLIQWLKPHAVGLIVLEASGGYERAAVVAMVNAGLPVFLAQPQVIRGFATSFNLRAKNDQIDAAVLARYARDRRDDVTPIAAIDPLLQALHAQVARRDQLIEMHTMEQNRLQQVNDKVACQSIRRTLAFLQKQIAGIEKAIDQSIKADTQLAARSARLQETRGVGPQTARVLIACLPELGNANPKRLNTLVGVAPYAQDSGDKHGPRHITGGRMLVRNALYMAALSASRCNPVIAGYYRSMRDRGLAHKSALMACIRRLLSHLTKQLRRLNPTLPDERSCP